MDKTSFEDNISYINQEISKRRHMWTLSSVSYMDFDDVSQIIRLHIYEKWYMYNPDKPLGPWLNKIIAHQIRNIVRNIYGNYARPCLRCCAAEGENLCKIYTTQCSRCPLFSGWQKSRQKAYDVKIPLPIENYLNETETSYKDEQDIHVVAEEIHKKMEKILKPNEWETYKLLFIDNLSEEEAAKKIGYTTSENGRYAGYKQIKNVRKNIMIKVKQLLASDEIDIL